MVAGALLLGALVAACSDGDDDQPSGGAEDRQSSQDMASEETQPAATDEDAAFPIVEDLALEATALVDDLYQEPTAIEDPDNQDLERLRGIYTDDSPTPPAIETQLRQLVDDGQRMRPAASGVFRDLGVYRPIAVDDNTIRFRICATEDRETIDSDGNVVDQRAQVTQGVGEARRIDGRWRFYGIQPDDDRTLAIEPGTANPGFCDRLFADQEGET
jgi:hypothetical protein